MRFHLPLATGLLLSAAAEGVGPPQAQPDLVMKGRLTSADFPDLKDRTFSKIHMVPLKAGSAYRIELESHEFNPYLRLRESTGREIAVQGGFPAAVVLVTAVKGGLYQVLVTSTKPGQIGPYVLTVKELDRAGLAAAQLEARVKRIGLSNPRGRRQVVDDLKKHLAGLGPRLTKKDVELAKQAAHSLEFVARDLPLAAETYASTAALVAVAADAEVARTARFLEGGARRLKLLNRPLSVKGVTVSGQPLDSKAYRGKMVLVSFVDTTGFTSQAEWRANIKFLYSRYKGRDFEVLGVGLNKDRESLEQFLKAEKIPWPCLHDDPAADGSPGPIAEGLGLLSASLPVNILLDREGKVLSTNAKGFDLAVLLQRYVNAPPAPAFPDRAGEPFPPGPMEFRPPLGQPAPPAPGLLGQGVLWAQVLIVLGVAFLLLLPFALILAYQAAKRGYDGVTWCVAGLLSFNPMFPLVVLALLPYRARQAYRLKELQALQGKLAAAQPVIAPEAAHSKAHSFAGNAAPAAARPAVDQETRDFPAKSLGDEETRL